MFARWKCKQWSSYWLDYALDRLPASQKTALEQHLRQCADCSAQAAEYRRAVNLATTALQQPQPTSQATWETLRLQLQQNSPSFSEERAARRGVGVRYLAGMGVALASITGLALWMPRVWTNSQDVPAVAPSVLAQDISACL